MEPNDRLTQSAPGGEALQKVLRGIEDPDFADRYPNRTHFIATEHPRHGEMATRALFDGDPVVLVYPDGHEILFRPEHVNGLAALFLALAALWLRFTHRDAYRGSLQLPPRTHVEARDRDGIPVAA